MQSQMQKILVFGNHSDDFLYVNSTIVVSEQLHGFLSGLICIEKNLKQGIGLDIIFKRYNADHDNKFQTVILNLYHKISRQLHGLEGKFELLFSSKTDNFLEQIKALNYWYHGFLHGLSFIDLTNEEYIPESLCEALRCISEIVKFDFCQILSKTFIIELGNIIYDKIIKFITDTVYTIYHLCLNRPARPFSLH